MPSLAQPSNLPAALRWAQTWAIAPAYPLTEGSTPGRLDCTCARGPKCKTPGKHPIPADGYKAAIRADTPEHHAQIVDWWTQHPTAGIGGIPASAGLLCIDVDIKPGQYGRETMEAFGPLPPTVQHRTGSGGDHIFFRYDGRAPLPKKLGPGVDLIHQHPWIILPPSMHSWGAQYETVPAAVPYAVLDDELLARILAFSSGSRRSDYSDDYAQEWTPVASALREILREAGYLRGVLTRAGEITYCPRDALHHHDPTKAHDVDQAALLFRNGAWKCQHNRCSEDGVKALLRSIERSHPELEQRIAEYWALRRREAVTRAIPQSAIEDRRQRAWLRVGLDRTDAYAESELVAMAPTDGRWALQAAGGFYFRLWDPTGGRSRYLGPYAEGMAWAAASELLAPAPVELHTADPLTGNLRRRTIHDIVETDGRVVDTVEWSYTDEHLIDGALTVQTARLVEIDEADAHYDTEIAHWLRLYAGTADAADWLEDWLAVVAELDRPLPGIVTLGETGVGKTLFALCVASLWQDSAPIPFEVATGKFNAPLARNPLIFADENVAFAERSAKTEIDALKTLVTDEVRDVADKHVRGVRLRGFVRPLLAANRQILARFASGLGQSDLDALDARYTVLHPDPEARAYLEALGGLDHTLHWTRGGRFRSHVAWLASQRHVPSAGRLRLASRGGVGEILSSAGDQGAILRWIGRALAALELPGSACTVGSVRMDDGEIWIAPTGIEDEWAKMSIDKFPRSREMWSILCDSDTPAVQRRTQVGRRMRFRKLRPALAAIVRAELGEGECEL